MKNRNQDHSRSRLWLAALAAAQIAALAVACGSGDEPPSGDDQATTPAPAPTDTSTTVACLPSETNVNGICVSNQTIFEQGCSSVGGKLDQYGGTQVCRVETSAIPSSGELLINKTSDLPRLTKSKPTSAKAYSTGLQLKAGARLVYDGEGYWGAPYYQTAYYTGKEYQLFSAGCNLYTLLGYNNYIQYTYDGMPAGLLGTDGTEVWLMDPETPKTIARDGELKIGVNAPPDSGDYCGYIRITTLKQIRCYDIKNATYPCE